MSDIARRSIRSKPNRREVAEHINAAFEAGDIADVCRAIEEVARLHNISELARSSGITRTSLYRAFAGGKAHPNFSTVLSVLHAMGFQLHVTLRPRAQAGRRMTKVQASAIRIGSKAPVEDRGR
ncbi:addiction module antidote protein (plasmid) [Bradyrhizobium sp. PMVTL-01]|uniref:addiction module antidote protein n=1 Tax=Bradyrhizobium sp. PMVTL-01 TaxID=3434999 RepID=UPI003F6EEA25